MDTAAARFNIVASDAPVAEFRRVLLATDLSAVSDRAADHAIEISAEHGASLLVLSVVDPSALRIAGGRFLRRMDQERSRVEKAAQALVARAHAAGVQATFLVWEGEPAESIVAASASEGVDLIILGSHRRGRLGRLILGSVSRVVEHEARCEVRVVPVGSPSPDGFDNWATSLS
ncbi:MAG: universal stress protein [Candidatus Limnocylindrales bacterium]